MAQASFPPIPKDIPRWMYEAFRRLQTAGSQAQAGLAAIGRGEAPDGSGAPLPIDLSQFFYLPGRSGGQLGHGGALASENLTLSSTKATSKGFVYIGDPDIRIALNETNGWVGINESEPTVALHVQGTAIAGAATILPNADRSGGFNNTGSGGWAPDETHYYTGAGTPVSGAHYVALSSNDGTTSWVARNGGGASGIPNGDNPERLGLDGTIKAGTTYNVTVSLFALGASPDAGNFLVYLSDENGDLWASDTVDLNGLSTTPTTIIVPVETFGTPAGTDTANGLALSADASLGVGGVYVCVSYVAIVGVAEDIQRWYDATGTLVAWVENDGDFDMPQINLQTGATLGYWLRCASAATGLAAWTAPAALTKTDDTNVTLTLGGSPTTALLNAASLTLGWTGQLSISRGGVADKYPADVGKVVVVGETTSAANVLGKVDLTAQTGDIGATTLLTSDSDSVGIYRCVFYLKTTTAGSGGAATKIVITYNDGTSQTPEVILVPEIASPGGGAVNHDLTILNQASYGSIIVYAAASTAITFVTSGTYTGSPEYTLRARIERLG